MAKMIPQTLPYDAPYSEKRVFGLLRDSPVTGDWIVIWSYRPPQFDLESGRRREVDFIILVPNRGLLCLEVKGGNFFLTEGEWYRPGYKFSFEAPDRQSERAMHSLRNDLMQRFGSNNGVMSTPIDFALAFTDWDWPPDLTYPTPLLFDRSVLDAPDQFVSRLVDAVAELSNPVNSSRNRSRRPNAETIACLMQYLAPNYALAAGPQLDKISEQLIRLTEEQYTVLDMFAENERCLVKGMAGTGKTMLALEFAKRSVHPGGAAALFCFNLLLGNYLKEQVSSNPRITAGGFWPDIIRPVILASSVAAQFSDAEFKVVSESELYDTVYPMYADLALRESGPQFDILVVDEAADLSRSPHLELMDRLLVGGLTEGSWVMFGDYSNQAILPGTEKADEFALHAYRPARVNLRLNCRNSLPIAQHTSRLTGIDLPDTRQIEGPKPEYFYWTDISQLSGFLDDQVHRFLADGVRVEEITVLSERRLENTGLDVSVNYGGYRLVTYLRGEPSEPDDGIPRLKFCTIPSFKGMESEVVILLLGRAFTDAGEATRHFDHEHAQAYVYIGMSRARGALVVLAQQSLQQEIESRLAH